MTEPTIQELIDDLVTSSGLYQEAVPGEEEHERNDDLQSARAALLSRITSLQQEADEWKASYTRALKDSDDLFAANTALKQEADEWHKVADELASELNEANSERFPVSWEDASESSPAWIAYCNLRDRKEIKTLSDNNK